LDFAIPGCEYVPDAEIEDQFAFGDFFAKAEIGKGHAGNLALNVLEGRTVVPYDLKLELGREFELSGQPRGRLVPRKVEDLIFKLTLSLKISVIEVSVKCEPIVRAVFEIELESDTLVGTDVFGSDDRYIVLKSGHALNDISRIEIVYPGIQRYFLEYQNTGQFKGIGILGLQVRVSLSDKEIISNVEKRVQIPEPGSINS
jgi:hypothetical protein